MEGFSTEKQRERAILVGVISNEQTEDQVVEYLGELAFLAETAGAIVEQKFTQRVNIPNPKTYIGSGKLIEIEQYIKVHEIEIEVAVVVIVSPRNAETAPFVAQRAAGGVREGTATFVAE